MYNYILALDPSGNFKEGKGTTGFILLSKDMDIIKLGEIKAADFKSQGQYWDAHVDLIKDLYRYNMVLVVEDFILYSNKAKEQIGSSMETPQLLGVLKYFSYKQNIDIVFQKAAAVKNRWKNEILEHKGFLKRTSKEGRYLMMPTGRTTNDHVRDALRHAVHFGTFYNK